MTTLRTLLRWARAHPRGALLLGLVLFAVSSARDPDAGLVIGFFELCLLLFIAIVAAGRAMFGMTFVQAARILRDHIDAEFDPEHDLAVAYGLLGVTPSTSDASLRRAHHALVRQLHPDGQESVPPAARVVAEERLKVVNAAHTLIVKSRRRASRQSDAGTDAGD
jgi:DnaJ domain